MKVTQASGTRKRAIARATLRQGTGKITINGVDLQNVTPEFVRLKIMEPLALAKDVAGKCDVAVLVQGGGIIGQADAVRLAIARALSEQSPKLKELFLKYDRHLIVADVRQRESRKPNTHGNARGKVQKSYR
ncbi:30S ribosomal protein S9 [Candidatus Woesearchaeota archaeon]|nr:MAG: 30S ribosomal protein S9 [Candidatus Woesearchaeota archaeon]